MQVQNLQVSELFCCTTAANWHDCVSYATISYAAWNWNKNFETKFQQNEKTLDHDEQSSFYVEPSSLELNSHDFNENIDE